MSDRTNEDRARDAKTALLFHAEVLGVGDEDPTDDVTDLVTNLMHFCAAENVDWWEVVNMANDLFEVEVYEEVGK
jgi:hypothetical protein